MCEGLWQPCSAIVTADYYGKALHDSNLKIALHRTDNSLALYESRILGTGMVESLRTLIHV